MNRCSLVAVLLALMSLSGADAVAQLQIVTDVSPPAAQSAVESSVAINPVNIDNLVAGSLVRGHPESPAPNFSFVSRDGGKSWTSVAVPNPDERTQGDDVVLFSADGVCVHAFIAFAGLWDPAPERAANGIGMVRSSDNGATWTPQTMVIDHFNSKSPMEDKPWLVFDRYRRSPHFGNLYCSWTRFDVYGSEDPQDTSQILFARSTDGGVSFEPVIRISDQGGDCRDDDNTVEGATPAVAPDGTVFVVWAGPRGIEMDKSADGGRTFGTDRAISDMPEGWASEISGIGRSNGMPVTAVDHSQSPYRGRLYVNWIDERNGNKDVFLLSSSDAGETWNSRVQVNDPATDQGREQFFTWMAVDPVDGSVNIAFYDRSATVGNATRLTLMRSIDGGTTFQNIPLDQPAFDCQAEQFFGDYLGIDALQGRVAIVYTRFNPGNRLGVASCVMDFKPGSCELIEHGSRTADQPEKITVQHILVGFSGSVPGKEIARSPEEAEKLARQLAEQARGGADFDALVKEHTDDQHPGIYQMANFNVTPDSVNAESEVPPGEKMFPRSGMVRAFGDVGFGLQIGEIGIAEYSPESSKYGWHVIRRIK